MNSVVRKAPTSFINLEGTLAGAPAFILPSVGTPALSRIRASVTTTAGAAGNGDSASVGVHK